MPPRKSNTSKATKAESTREAPKTTRSTRKSKKVVEAVVEEAAEEITQNKIAIKDVVIEKAVKALSEWTKLQSEASTKLDLFETEDSDIPLYLQVASSKYFAQTNILKPRMLEIPHTIHDLDDAKVCLFVKDGLFDEESLARVEIMKDNELKNLAQIVTVNDLKTKYHQFEARRKLLSEFDIFLTDSSIANMIPKLLGKTFFSSSKLPLTINITDKKNLSFEKLTRNFTKALNSTGFVLPMGNNTSFKLGMLGQNIEHIKENIHTITKFLEQFPIRLVQLKLNGSPTLPIFIAKKIYSDEDIISSTEENKEAESATEIPLSIYAEGLKELGLDEEEANALFGAKKRTQEETKEAVEVEAPVAKKSKKSKA